MLILQTMLGKAYTDTHAWPVGLGVLIGAVAVYLLGLQLNKPGRTLVDPATGQTVILRRRHTLFWIPLQYLAGIIALIGLVMLFVKPSST